MTTVTTSVIIQKDDPILRRIAKDVSLNDIGGEKLNKIIHEMAATLDKCDDGVALAAPQIGISERIFVVSPKTFLLEQECDVTEEAIATSKRTNKLVYINPIISKRSSKKAILDEGCLSVRGTFGKIKRHEKVTITAYDENRAKFTRGASGLLAEIFQHETDHLDGKLFIDTATDLIKLEAKPAPHAK